MECKDFQKLINDFIFDKIEYSEDLKEFKSRKNMQKLWRRIRTLLHYQKDLAMSRPLMAVMMILNVIIQLMNLENIINFYMMNILKTMSKERKQPLFLFLFFIKMRDNVNDYIWRRIRITLSEGLIFKYHWKILLIL